MNARAPLVLAILVLTGCPSTTDGQRGKINFRYAEPSSDEFSPSHMIAVGALQTYRLSDGGGRPDEILEVESGDTNVFEVESIDGDHVSLRAVGEGTTNIKFGVREVDGDEEFDIIEQTARPAKEMGLHHCSPDRTAFYLADQTGLINFTLYDREGTRLLGKDYHPFTIEPEGAATLNREYDERQLWIQLEFGSKNDADENGEVTLRSEIDETFLTFGLATLDQINGVAMGRLTHPVKVSETAAQLIEFYPAIDDVRVCQVGSVPETRSLTPETCESNPYDLSQEGSVTVRGIEIGECTIEVSFPDIGSDVVGTFDFTIEPDE